MIWIAPILALLAAGGLIASAIGWRHSLLQRERSPEWYFAAGKVLYSIGFGCRLIFWDVGFGTLAKVDHASAIALYDAMGGTDINAGFNCIILLGVYCSMRARQLLIPADVRDRWPWPLAWMHPRRIRLLRR